MAKQKLTPQQKLLVKGLVKGLSITDAAKEAGYSEKYAGQVGSQALENIRLKMPEVLERHGLTDDSLVENYLKPALQATETKFAQFEGAFTDEREVLAWGPRLTALDIAFNLKGSYAPKPSATQNTAIGIKVIVEHIGRRNQDSVTAQTV